MDLILIDIKEFNPIMNQKIENLLFNLKPVFKDSIVIRFWINSSSLFIGKFQIPELEINLNFVKNNKIPYIRRDSGGGTVYHDKGVLNVSILKNKNYFFKSHMILEETKFLTSFIAKSIFEDNKINYNIDGRNGIFINSEKVGGSAVAIKNGLFLYHTSLLIKCNLEFLKNSIKWDTDYENFRKTIRSKRSKVTNLSKINKNFTISFIKNKIVNEFKKKFIFKNIYIVKDETNLKKYFL